ncbi:adenosylcobalamin-dependent ribonucleoside-diphosphate reductase [Candidatus Woesebacteria bacterium]|nr:MAG: adenosylcobalamin-dependent ribonucleoside-diphosphate reductase [Candidatus Woesebacteria bacterium]
MKKNIVEKIHGAVEEFKEEKIVASIYLAAKNVGSSKHVNAKRLSREVMANLQKLYPNGEPVKTTDIGEIVEKVLIESGHSNTAKEFIRYRENKKHLRKDKDSLGVKDDIGLSYNTLYILKERYLKRNDKGKIIETPLGMIERVARFVANSEKTKAKREKWYQEFHTIMADFDFLPGTRTLTNSGKKTPQLANCFVWPMFDDVDKIFEVLHKSTVVKKHGGGCGYNFSSVRPEGDSVGGIPELAAGPVKMIEMFDLMTSLFRQEGKYESGNMAVLNANHADIFNFISAKQNDGYLSKTNISVGITDEFMKAALSGKDWGLINPRTGKVVNTVKASSILDLMSTMAWQTGDPGIINLSAINKGNAFGNPLLAKRGAISATNPCGEEPLFPFESCNLGYINFVKFISERKGVKEFDFNRLKRVVKVATRFMDNVIDASWFPVKEVTDAVRNHRRIGIGGVGWAECLAILEIPYDSQKAFDLAEKLTKTMYESAFESSCDIAKEKGPFPLVVDSIWANKKRKPRNVALLTFPPSSGNAVICETSFGVEPYFALAYEQNVLGGMRLTTVVPLFVEKLKERGLYSDQLIQKIVDNHGSCQGIDEVPKDLQKIFKVAHDINWRDHVKMQAAFQKWTDNAITKTINMPSSATPQDIEDAYVLAWKLGCKGLTVYRDRTKSEQVFSFGEDKERKEGIKTCPTCKIKLVRDKKCYKCKQCGFSTCEL